MSQQTIGIGASANDGTGDPLRTAFDKANDNFDEVYAALAALGPASVTELLTGTNAAKAATPDAIAGLWEKGSDVASAGTISLGEGGVFHITGTTTITDIDFATPKDGRLAWLIFDGALTLTHHATSLKLPGGANITTAANDRALVMQDASDNVIVLAYIKADGTPVVASQPAFSGALVRKASDQTTADYTAAPAVAWDQEAYDVGGWHDTVTNNSRLTVPAGVTHVRVSAGIQIDVHATGTYYRAFIGKNGSLSYDGMAGQMDEGTHTIGQINLHSPVLAVSPGDYFELNLDTESDNSITVTAATSWFAIEKVR